jgi:hypothetical protein
MTSRSPSVDPPLDVQPHIPPVADAAVDVDPCAVAHGLDDVHQGRDGSGTARQ